ncbi:Bifunctional ligase/repressor BirA [Candidatus Methylobacter favarea]|uniref:Bifunctional ligase/repressor BirA n=1 Tax=Candidatus Methylobacter favarea TaxID=2707345 RepID=A0A8S0WJQ6_9GAMM|nr:bifunctional biotin--[acetyl-CoA-carboxylase] ligase/biotin operon repressor BirA [Candidatus Methylobacter favarea]CAA9891478.1 Bifunctional ligase/repressor BirA [Candidatus Methylobacter favarea]
MVIADKQKKILTLLADGEFHSGSDLARALGVSRSAIWKQLNCLAESGLQHSAVSGKGYRLDKSLELLAQSEIYEVVNEQAKALISSFEIHDQINSTNSYLVECAHRGAPSGFICFAERQTAGKGRRGRQWVSPYGSNIYLSILWRYQQGGPAAISGLSLAVGIAVIRALKQHNINNIGLKWPNDIYSRGKKLGGILVEVSGESDGPCTAVIGLGLNLFLSETESEVIAQAWTDLSKITGQHKLFRNELAGTLLNHLLPVIAGFESVGIKAYLDEWRAYDCLAGRLVTILLADKQLKGTVEGINDTGMLLLKHADGSVQAYASGEVSFNSQSDESAG